MLFAGHNRFDKTIYSVNEAGILHHLYVEVHQNPVTVCVFFQPEK